MAGQVDNPGKPDQPGSGHRFASRLEFAQAWRWLVLAAVSAGCATGVLYPGNRLEQFLAPALALAVWAGLGWLARRGRANAAVVGATAVVVAAAWYWASCLDPFSGVMVFQAVLEVMHSATVLALGLFPLLCLVPRLGIARSFLVSGVFVVCVTAGAAVVAVREATRSTPEYRFLRGGSHDDPELGWRPEPNSLIREYFADNPRGYFLKEDPALSDFLDRWRQVSHGGLCWIEPAGSPDEDIARITIVRTGEAATGEVVLRRLPAVRSPGELKLSFRARAEAERNCDVFVNRENGQVLSKFQTLSLRTDWQDVSLGVPGPLPDDATLVLNCGAGVGEIEMAAMSLDGNRLGPLSESRAPRFFVDAELNSHGFRDRDYLIPRPVDTYRILVLGDSFAFGMGVHAEDLVTERLEAQLNQSADGGQANGAIEVVNCGIPAYGTRQQRLLLERFAGDYEPQLVLVLMVAFDDYAPGQQRQPGLELALHDYAPCLDDLDRIGDWCAAHGARLAVAAFRHVPLWIDAEWTNLVRTVGPALQARKVPWIDLGDAIVTEWAYWRLGVHASDGHPNEIAHARAAARLETFLRQHRLLSPGPEGVTSGDPDPGH